ncbi:hypothetical protein ABZT11_43145, partial [Streptomyces avermitilis]
ASRPSNGRPMWPEQWRTQLRTRWCTQTSTRTPRPRTGIEPAIWLREALVAVGARSVRHRGAHRWVFRLGRTRREREEIRLGLLAQQPYPKRPGTEPCPS